MKENKLSEKDFKDIIIRMPNWIGDFVMATAIIEDIRKKYKNSRITILSRGKVGDIIINDPRIDEVLAYSSKKQALKLLKKQSYDLGVLLPNSFSSAQLFFSSKIKYRLGYRASFRSLLLNSSKRFSKDRCQQHLVDTYKDLLSLLGIERSSSQPRLFLSKEELIKAKEKLKKLGYQDNNVLIGINPGAAYGMAKCWLPERFREVARKIVDRENWQVVFFGDNSQIPLINSICKELPEKAINLAGKTELRELACMIHECDVLLTNDSGPMHVAAALDIPIVAIFGSTSSIVTGPYNKTGVIHKHIKCSPCFLRKCPYDLACMKKIEVDEVYQHILDRVKYV